MNSYEVKNGQIVSEGGFPWQPRLFCDNRLMFEINDNTISEIKYFNVNSFGNDIMLKKNFYPGLTFYLENSRFNYKFSPSYTSMTPFGFKSVWNIPGGNSTFEISAINDSLIIKLHTESDFPKGFIYHIDIHQDFFFVPHNIEGDFANPQLKGCSRNWKGFTYADEFFEAGFKTTNENNKSYETALCMKSDFNAEIRETLRNKKFVFSSGDLEPATDYLTVISFDTCTAKAKERCIYTLNNIKSLTEEKQKRYKAVFEKSPVLECKNKALSDFMALCPLFNESLKVDDTPGALRSNTKHYWVWGSDSLYRGPSLAYWGDNEYNSDILDLAEKLGSPYICAYSNDCKKNVHRTEKSFTFTDAVYITYLYSYIVGGGKLDESRYNVAKSIFNEICLLEKDNLGLFCTGGKLHFDYSAVFKSTNAESSAFGVKENGLFYMAIRCMQYLAYLENDKETLDTAARLSKRFEDSFMKICFDRSVGYFPAATDSNTLEHLPSHCAYLMLYENDFMTDAMEESFAPAVEYFKKNFISKNGLRPLSKDHPAYDGDANQMHCWWPAYNADMYSRMISMTDNKELTEQYTEWITYWSERLTMPEGYDCYDDNDNPEFDYWNMCCGAWQMFTYRAFYQSVIRSLIGLDFDNGGLTVYPRHGEEMKISNLHSLGKIFSVHIKGSGTEISEIEVNGKIITGTAKIPYDLLKSDNEIVVHRCEKSTLPFFIRCFNGAKLTEYSRSGNCIQTTAEFTGHNILKLKATQPIGISIDQGDPVTYSPDENNLYKIELSLTGNHRIIINI